MAWRNHWGQLHWPTCIARIILASLFTTNPFHFFNQAGQPVSHGYVSQSGYSVLHGYNNISAGAWVARVDSIIVKLGGPCGTVSSTEWAGGTTGIQNMTAMRRLSAKSCTFIQ